MNQIMKKNILLFIFFLCVKGFAQSNGITYQAVILKPTNKISTATSKNLPVANKNVCMQFQFVDEFSKIEYQEVIQTTTDQYGMVNLVIGTGTRNGGYASSFNDITWVAAPKRLAVSINISGECSSFTEISNQPFTTVPFAYAATNSTNVTGVVAIENGGTNATTIIGAKTTLELDQVNNTSDAAKPISDATKSALQLKEDIVNKSTNLLQDGTSDVKFPTVKATKTYVDTGINTVFTTIQSALDLKANLASPTFTGTVSGIDKTMVGLSNVDNTSDANKPVSAAAQTALDLKANLA